jgi:hypothetical protein
MALRVALHTIMLPLVEVLLEPLYLFGYATTGLRGRSVTVDICWTKIIVGDEGLESINSECLVCRKRTVFVLLCNRRVDFGPE